MKYCIFVFAIALCATAASGQSVNAVAAQRYEAPNPRTTSVSADNVVRELMTLRGEIRELKIAFHQLRIAALEHDLEQSTAARQRLDVESESLRTELQELEENLRQPLDSQSYANLMESKTHLMNSRAVGVTRERQSAAHREAEAARLLAIERNKLQLLLR